MSSERWEVVDALIGDLLLAEDAEPAAALAANAEADLPRIDVSPPQGKLLSLLVRVAGARRVLELGTLGGYSTIWLARGLPADGRIVTLELEQRHADVARENVDRAGVGGRVDIRVGPALDTLDDLEREGAGPFDLVFIDADKATYPDYLDRSLRLSRPGTLIVGDNVVRRGDILDPEDPNAQGARRFLELLGSDPRLDATAIQTVGSKGHDGLSFALVR